MHSNSIQGSVVVITGASSGIGLSTAKALAKRRARLVLVARGQDGLDSAKQACELLGATVLTLSADVIDETSMHDVARAAIEHFEHIDVWINNAGVLMYGKLVDTPSDLWKRVIEINLFGYVHGARAALPVFMRQRRGILINNALSLGLVGMPNSSSYVASKFAIIGLSECLRFEVDEYEDIHICTLTPPAVDTPIYLHAANLTGRNVGPVPLVYDAQSVADAMVELVERPRPVHDVGVEDAALRLGLRAAPAAMKRVAGFLGSNFWVRKGTAHETLGNLYESLPPHDESGGFGTLGKKTQSTEPRLTRLSGVQQARRLLLPIKQPLFRPPPPYPPAHAPRGWNDPRVRGSFSSGFNHDGRRPGQVGGHHASLHIRCSSPRPSEQ